LALREDPSYFADTILEFEEHTPDGTLGPSCNLALKVLQRKSIVRSIVEESYCTLAGWQELDRRFADLDYLFQDDANIFEQICAVREVENVAQWMKDKFAHTIKRLYLQAPNVRKMMHRKSFKITDAQSKVLFSLHFVEMLTTPAEVSCHLETIDKLLQSDSECKALISGCIMSLLTDLSILAECFRQIHLWGRSPEVLAICTHLKRDMTPSLGENGDFLLWEAAMKDVNFPTTQVYPYQEKLFYPADRRQNRKHVQAMCQAEANLDKFWAAVDSMYKEKTGVAQHDIIRKCLEQGGKMQRTAPWVEPTVLKPPAPVKKQEYDYQPLSRMVHNKALQITGAFDKLSIEEKSKTKTRSATDDAVGQHPNLAVQAIGDSFEKLEKPFIVDQRTHKVFKTIFYTPTSETGDLPKSVKWAEFKRAMARVGFAVEKLQGSAWQ
jgi:hypothetical protein